VMIPTPGGKSFLMPVARVMSLYRRHGGAQALEVAAAPEGLDVTASRTGNRLFLHVVNTNRTQPVEAALALAGMKVASATAFEIAADPEFETIEPSDTVAPKRKELPKDGRWTFPAASVTAVEAEIDAP
jgi:alpha-N-arabinofuranosidase